jgi:hypothetical protein
MKGGDVPVGKRFVATVINSEGKEDCIAVECVSTDVTNKCSMCVFAEKKECAKYYCVERQRKDGKSVYFREIDPRTRSLKKENKYEVGKDKDVSEQPAIAENKETGNDCAEIEADIKSWAFREKIARECKDGFLKTRAEVEVDGAGAVDDNAMVVHDNCENVREICECASKLLELSEFQKEIKPEQEYCFKIYKKSRGVVTEVPFDFNGCLSDKMFEQLPCIIDKRIKDLKHLINKL